MRVLYALPVVTLLILLPTSRASLWEDETLAARAKGLPDLVRIVTGRFERNPPLYYEMRLARATARIQAVPSDLAAYDVAGVACDQLNRDDEAIAWMERKNLQLESMVVTKARTPEDLRDHFYRCLANIGTFWAHRWARAGGDPARIDEVKMARDFIAKAIALYPELHFERDRYQVRMLERLIALPRYQSGRLPPLLDFDDPTNRTAAAVRALAELIVLGNEAESVDLFNTLAQALEHEEPPRSAALLARLRCHELIDDGLRSIVPGAPGGGSVLAAAIDPPGNLGTSAEASTDQSVRAAYRTLRAEAEAWQHARTAFMTQRLDQGLHPNTDRDFWKGYDESAPATLAIPEVPATDHAPHEWALSRLHGLVIASLTALGLAAVLAWMTRRNTLRNRRAPVLKTKR
jgi:hypothetical protein